MVPTRLLVALVSLVAAALAPLTSSSGAAAAATAKPSLAAPASVVEGDRYEVTVKVPRAAKAVRVLLQRWTKDHHGDAAWETVASRKVRGKARQAFRAVAGEDDSDRYRARVEYAAGKPVMSKPTSVTVWHWTDLFEFDMYYETSGIWSTPSTFAINGSAYRGLGTFGGYGSYEARFTTGRHCRAVRGTLGVSDSSGDGATAVISLVADDMTPVLTSATLTPGMAQPFEVELALPYRLAVRLQSTSPAGVKTYPVVGAPELLCTGVQ